MGHRHLKGLKGVGDLGSGNPIGAKINTDRLLKLDKQELTINEFLELQMKDFLGGYSKAINKQESRTGSLIQQRTKRVLLNTSKVLGKICYVHHNPLHHRFATNYQNWIFSSYNAFLTEKTTKVMRIEVWAIFEKYFRLAYSPEDIIRFTEMEKIIPEAVPFYIAYRDFRFTSDDNSFEY
jgi:hypothetical protein